MSGRSSARRVGVFAAFFALYVATAKGGLALDAVSGFATLVWPPTGIALAGLLLFGDALLVEAEGDLRATCDRARVLQVLSNLLDNAIKFSSEGAVVTLCVKRVDAYARVSVRDHGIGIAPSDLRHVFERHWRARSSTAGTGLGLFIARGIVHAHAGRLWAESEPGVGSTFAFTLPVARDSVHRADARAGVTCSA